MKLPKLDKSKLATVKKIISEIERFATEENCGEDSWQLKALAQELKQVTQKDDIEIRAFMRFSSCVTLETAAEIALMPIPQKLDLTDKDISELVLKIANVEFDEAATDYFLKVLRLETGLRNITDYIYNPDEIGMDLHASIEEITERIIADKNQFKVLD